MKKTFLAVKRAAVLQACPRQQSAARLRAADRRGTRGQDPLPYQPGTTLRIREQVNPTAQIRPLKFRVAGQFRDVPLPAYISEAMDKHIASHGITPDGYFSRAASTSS
jgi:hypothetical protein